VQLYLFDFAGTFEALFSDQPKQVYNKLSAVKKGDVVYVLCKFIPINSPDGYFVLGNAVYYEEELCSIKDKIASIKHEIDKIKSTQVDESPSFILDHSRHSIDTIRLFLAKNDQINRDDYYYLAQAVYDMCKETGRPMPVDLLGRCFCKFAGYADDAINQPEIKEEFVSWYPDLSKSIAKI
jgi:hypothetical protein